VPTRDARVAQRAAAPTTLGSIDRIDPITRRPPGNGTGAVIGGVAGAVIGNQFGHGLGRAAMTGLGAAGGAFAGNNVERNVRKTVVGYRIHVRLDDGSTRTFERSHVGDLHVGDRVRVGRDGLHRA
jgi:outer membrane lipoprotein SlyB